MNILEKAKEMRASIERIAQNLDDETALEAVSFFPTWSGDSVAYKSGIRVKYEGILYKVLQDHTSQADWTPTGAPSLFTKVLIEDPNVVSEWVQPDSTNPYSKGDKVSHNSKTWVSDVDNNVWEPGIYGWTEES